MKALLQDGHLGGLRLGVTRQDVRAAWGEPPDWSLPTGPARAGIWLYGEIEVHFDPDDAVWLFHCDRGDLVTWRGAVDRRVEPWIIGPALDVPTLEAALDALGVAWERLVRSDDEPGVVRMLARGEVELGFEAYPEGATPTLAYWSWCAMSRTAGPP